MFTRKRVVAFCTVITAVIIMQLLMNTLGVKKALAETIPITYNGSTTQANGVQYSTNGNLSMNPITLDAGTGKTIQDAYFVSGTSKTLIPWAAGQQKFDVKNSPVQQITVSTGLNKTAQGYYAWYRYTPGDPHGVNWYEQGGKNLACGIPNGAPKEYVNGTTMPVFPNCTDDQLSLGGRLTYKDESGNVIPVSSVVLPSTASFVIDENKFDTIPGPDGLNGKTWGNTTIVGPEIIDAANFKVKYSQTFDDLGATEDFSLPGAKMTVYFAAFYVTVASKTFQYPDAIEVTYSNSPAPTPAPTYTPPPTGYDFTVPSFVAYKNSIPIHPKINNGTCLYYSHSYTITKNGGGGSWRSGSAPDRDVDTVVSYPYPSPLRSGNFQVTMTVKDGCGTHIAGPKPLTIGANPDNKPPFAKLAWFKHGTNTPITTAVQGDLVNLGVVFDSTSPKDPDGDPVSAKAWDFNASTDWIKNMPTKYSLDLSKMKFSDMLIAEDTGDHTVNLTVTDGQGGNYTASATLHIASPNPIACITGPISFKAERPIPFPFESCSTSPTNSAIIQEDWTNKYNQYDTPGPNGVYLKVKDQAGRWSGNIARFDFMVIPDLPPIAGLDLPLQTTRNNQMTINSKAFSPDFDQISRLKYEYRYDANNNGFTDDSWILLHDGNSTSVPFTPSQVGKYQFKQTAWETWGKSGDTLRLDQTHYTLDVTNQAPTVQVQTTGQTTQPKNMTPYPMASIFNGWNFTRTAGGGTADKSNWTADHTGLTSKVSRPSYGFESEMGYFTNTSFGGSTTRGLGRPSETVFSGIANAFDSSNIRDLGAINQNFTNYSRHFADEKYVYFLGGLSDGSNILPKIMAYDKNMNLAWSQTYPGYRGAQSFTYGGWDGGYYYEGMNMISYKGSLYSSWSTGYDNWHMVRIDQTTGQLQADIQIPHCGCSPEHPMYGISRFLIVNDQLNVTSYYGTYIYDLNMNPIKSSPLGGGDNPQNTWGLIPVPDQNIAYHFDNTSHAIALYQLDDLTTGPTGYIPKWTVKPPTPINQIYDGGIQVDPKTKNLVIFYEDYSSNGWIAVIDKYGNILSNKQAGTTWQGNALYDFDWRKSAGKIAPLGLDGNGHFYIYNSSYPYTFGFMIYDIYTGQLVNFIHKNLSYTYFNLTNRFYLNADDTVTIFLPGGISNYDNGISIRGFNPSGGLLYESEVLFPGPATSPIVEYVGDKKILVNDASTYGVNKDHFFFIDMSGTANSYPKQFQLGTPFSDLWWGGASLSSETLKLNLMPTKVSGEGVGVAFRVRSWGDYYSLEFENGKLRFKRTWGGTNTAVLGEVPYGISNNNSYRLKVIPYLGGGGFNIYVNEIYQFSINEDWWGSGYSGIINRGQQGVRFTNMQYESGAGLGGSVSGVALVNQTITYTVDFSDPENDPRLVQSESWKYTHNPSVFLNSGGTWGNNGQTFGTPVTSFSIPGEYTFDFRSRDDPNPSYKFPSMVFDKYRQWSNTLNGKIRVHRPPVAQFTMGENANHTLWYNDTSYDPDRYNPSNGAYSTEATGINYQTTRGIVERKWRYKKPSDSAYTDGKLLNPPMGSTWTIELAAKDEYGAWSEWYSQEVTTAVAAPSNGPPVAALTFPNGTQGSPNSISTLRPTVTWNESDPDAGADISLYQVVIADQNGSWVYNSASVPQGTSPQSMSHTLTSSLNSGTMYQAYVRIFDGLEWSGWSGPGWFRTNSPPAVVMTYPDGTSTTPTQVATLRPTFRWSQTDPDAGTLFHYFQLQVYEDAANVRILDSGQRYQGTSSTTGSWTSSLDLPTNKKLRVIVRVFDGYVWSDGSPPTYLYINRPPNAAFDWLPKPLWEGDKLQLLNQSADPDDNPLTYDWTLEAPDGVVSHFTTRDVRDILTKKGDYRVTLAVSDGRLASSVSKTIAVTELSIHSEVNHTPQWLVNHQLRGHQTDSLPKDFYSGEMLLVTTDSSPAPVAEAWASLDTVGIDGNAIQISVGLQPDASGIHFAGELYDPILESMTGGLPPGIVNIHFRLVYANGTVKEEDIPIHILGSVNEFLGVHRVR